MNFKKVEPMDICTVTRRQLFVNVGALLVATQLPRVALGASPDRADSGIRLQPLPGRIYKTRDAGNERTESWVFWLLVETNSPRRLKIQTADLTMLNGARPLRTTHLEGEGVQALTITPPFKPKLLDGSPSAVPIFWPQAVRVRCTESAASKIDGMRIELGMIDIGSEGTGDKLVSATLNIPVEEFAQKTNLIYPFKGRGIVTNAGVTNGGHRNRSGQFAIDVVGLDEHYGVYLTGDGRKSTDYAGWRRVLIAPAAGVVVRARADRPDQPDPENSDPKFFAPEFPNGGDPGNHLVIDHGNGEFSMLAHLQAGSVLVKVGDRVAQGQPLGKLGSSGDTETPHLHYQLQSGRDHEWSDGLPCKFSNITESSLTRGTYFHAK